MSSVPAYLVMGQVALIVHHPDGLGKERFALIEQVNQTQSYLIVAQGELDTIKEKKKGVIQKVAKPEDALRIGCEKEQKF